MFLLYQLSLGNARLLSLERQDTYRKIRPRIRKDDRRKAKNMV